MARSRATYKDWIKDDNLLQIEAWASKGLTNKDIAKNIGVSEGTFGNWITKYDEISGALKKGRKPVVREIENALIKKAKGFEYEEQTVYLTEGPSGSIKKQIVKHKRYSPPDTSAAIFLLKNYEPEKYRNYTELTKKQIETEVRKLELEAEKLQKEIDEDFSTQELIINYRGIPDDENN